MFSCLFRDVISQFLLVTDTLNLIEYFSLNNKTGRGNKKTVSPFRFLKEEHLLQKSSKNISTFKLVTLSVGELFKHVSHRASSERADVGWSVSLRNTGRARENITVFQQQCIILLKKEEKEGKMRHCNCVGSLISTGLFTPTGDVSVDNF